MKLPFEDLRDSFGEKLVAQWERIQESSVYISLKERYENLNQRTQRLIILAAVLSLLFVVFVVPYSYFSSSLEANETFVYKRSLMQGLSKVSSIDISPSSVAMPLSSVSDRIQSLLTEARIMPEQIKSVETTEEPSPLVPKSINRGGVRVQLSQLTVPQIADVGHQLSIMFETAKLKDMTITATKEDPHYFDVMFFIVQVGLEQQNNMEQDNEEENKPSRKRGRP